MDAEDPLYYDYVPKRELLEGMHVNIFDNTDTLCLLGVTKPALETSEHQFFLLTSDSNGNRVMIRGNWKYENGLSDYTKNHPGYLNLRPWGEFKGWACDVDIKDSLYYDKGYNRTEKIRVLVLDTLWESFWHSFTKEAVEEKMKWRKKSNDARKLWLSKKENADKHIDFTFSDEADSLRAEMARATTVKLNAHGHLMRFESRIFFAQ
jgi:hypothetical protein